MTVETVQLREWQTATPETTPGLAGLSLPPGPAFRSLANRLNERQILTVRELRSGLEITTNSFVGSLSLGSVTLRVEPKLEPGSLAVLLGYALGLPHIELLPEHIAKLAAPAFQDLLALRLAEEVTRLLARGIQRQYKIQETKLQSPRGRILFNQIARGLPAVTPTLPCRFHERDEDVLPNRVLLSGLRLAADVALDSSVRQRVYRPLTALADRVRPVVLNSATMRDLERRNSRLLSAYEPAFAVIRLLMSGQGITTQRADETFSLPGFMFNMNIFFQQALGRFLRESLEDTTVHEQYAVADLFQYQPLFNPRRKRSPTPRPDYVFVRQGRVVAIADAKYRDLWERDLSRDMLYQLSIYALSQTDCRVASIIYPAADPNAREARITINDPTSGRLRGEVHLRPVNVGYLADLIRRPATAKAMRARTSYAEHLALGASPQLSLKVARPL